MKTPYDLTIEHLNACLNDEENDNVETYSEEVLEDGSKIIHVITYTLIYQNPIIEHISFNADGTYKTDPSPTL